MSANDIFEDIRTNDDEEEPQPGGSKPEPDAPKHAGTRDVTEWPAGGGTETGGTRNYPSTGGATGVDIGHRPE